CITLYSLGSKLNLRNKMMRFGVVLLALLAGLRVCYALEVDMNIYSYYADKTYAEVHLRVQESSVQSFYENGENKVGIEFLVIAYDQHDAVVYGDKFVLNGKRGADPKDYLAIKRFFVGPGFYRIHVTAKDLYAENNMQEFEKSISVFEDWDGQYGISDPMFTARLTSM